MNTLRIVTVVFVAGIFVTAPFWTVLLESLLGCERD